ncbi:MAG TPA: hypothetical protein VMV92_11455 [Streptosporangiaceae bacterium]|nr:hypothetical protein [Streptosporangiaceae bacterium]
MAYPHPAAPTVLHAPPAPLEPGPIGVPQDRNTGMVSRAPAVSAGLRSTALAVATAYGSGLRFILMALPVLAIVNTPRRLNRRNARRGACIERAGRPLSICPGLLAGWLMTAATVIAAASGAGVPGLSVVAVAGLVCPAGAR